MSQKLVCRCKEYECCPICGGEVFQREVAKLAEPEIVPAGKTEETLAQALLDAAVAFRHALQEHESAENYENSTNRRLSEALSNLEDAEKHLTNYLTEKEKHHEQT